MNTNDFCLPELFQTMVGWGVLLPTGIPMLIFLDVILMCFIATWLIVRRTILGHVSMGATQDMVTMDRMEAFAL